MTDKLKEDKIFAIKNWQIFVFILVEVFLFGSVYGVSDYRLNKVETEVNELKNDYFQFKQERAKALGDIDSKLSKMEGKIDIIYEYYKNKIK